MGYSVPVWRSKGFTLFMSRKALCNSVEAAAVVPEDFEVPFGKARIHREGTDLKYHYVWKYNAFLSECCGTVGEKERAESRGYRYPFFGSFGQGN